MTAWYTYPVTHGYIPQYEAGVFDTPHYAEDVGTPEDTQLTAILPGTVERADYQAWGGEIFIKPDNTAYPEYYYYHTDLNEVQQGQHVNAGQEIALSGGQTSGGRHPVTDGESTGPHTHLGWFTKYVTPSETGYTIPYGPDPSNLIAMAGQGGGGQTSMVPSNIYSQVEPYAQQYHVPDPIWETVAYMESNFNPTAINTSSGNPAVGLFQLLENAGQGAGYSTTQLDDPGTNARVGVQAIGTTWQNLGPTFDPNSLQWWEEFAAQSGHPGGAPGQAYTDQVAQTMMTDYQKFAGGSNNATLANTSASQACQAPAWNQPWLWPSYWACQAQQSATNSVQSVVAAESQWIGSTIGPLFLRVGVGLTGIVLIVLGVRDIADGLKNSPDLIDNSQPQQKQSSGGKRESKKAKRTEKKKQKEEKPAAHKENQESQQPAKKKPSKEASAGEETGEASSGASTAEVAAVAA